MILTTSSRMYSVVVIEVIQIVVVEEKVGQAVKIVVVVRGEAKSIKIIHIITERGNYKFVLK